MFDSEDVIMWMCLFNYKILVYHNVFKNIFITVKTQPCLNETGNFATEHWTPKADKPTTRFCVDNHRQLHWSSISGLNDLAKRQIGPLSRLRVECCVLAYWKT